MVLGEAAGCQVMLPALQELGGCWVGAGELHVLQEVRAGEATCVEGAGHLRESIQKAVEIKMPRWCQWFFFSLAYKIMVSPLVCIHHHLFNTCC